MLAKGLTPILNVSDIQTSFAWFEKLGWSKGFDCGKSALPTTSEDDSADKRV